MKRSDLHRKYADMIDMCEGTKVKARQCVRFDGSIIYSAPMFNGYIDSYRFALAIVENRPVFAGDVLYKKGSVDSYTVTGHENNRLDRVLPDFYTWTKPVPFLHILKAQAEGKRIVFFDGAEWVDTDEIDCVNFKPESYRVVEHNKCEEHIINSVFGEQAIIRFKKCGITGKISAEVLK